MPTIVDSATFLARYPEFSEIDSTRIDVFLEDVEADTSKAFFGDLHPRAIAALAAHRIATQLDLDGNALVGDQPGALTAASADGVSSSYAVPEGIGPADLALWRTSYGQAYLELRNRCGRGPIVAC